MTIEQTCQTWDGVGKEGKERKANVNKRKARGRKIMERKFIKRGRRDKTIWVAQIKGMSLNFLFYLFKFVAIVCDMCS